VAIELFINSMIKDNTPFIEFSTNYIYGFSFAKAI